MFVSPSIFKSYKKKKKRKDRKTIMLCKHNKLRAFNNKLFHKNYFCCSTICHQITYDLSV